MIVSVAGRIMAGEISLTHGWPDCQVGLPGTDENLTGPETTFRLSPQPGVAI
jgi:hypothetical protein